MNLSTEKQKLIFCVVLTVVTLAVYWQVSQFDFVNFDDNIYVTENNHVKSGISLDGIRWAFSTNHFPIWIPLIWLSLMLDYQLFGLNAGGYHVVNLIIHMISTLLLFWLICRMTKEIWKGAFVAAFFALHPLHVESVAWITERKDVLSAFFWMLTLCFYVYYTQRTVLRRYLLVLFSFVLAMMSKPMVITLPLIMILLDYWPLRRFESRKNNLFLWQLKEKTPFFILAAALTLFTIYNTGKMEKYNKYLQTIPLDFRLANIPVSFITYLEKTFWPYDMAIFYPFPAQIPLWQILGTSLLIIAITAAVIITVKRMPYLFAGWMWCMITILPVIGIIQVGNHAMADRYHYLPSIGLAMMLAWGIPDLIRSGNNHKKIIFPAGIALLAILSILTWKQCGYWKNTNTLFNHALKVTENNYIAHNNIGVSLLFEGKITEAIAHYNRSIDIRPDYIDAYNNLGNAFDKLGEHQKAFEIFNKAIAINPDHRNNFNAYVKRGILYARKSQYHEAINDFDKAIALKPDYADAYYNRGIVYANTGRYQQAIDDYNKGIALKPDYADAYYNRGVACTNVGQYQSAIENYDKAIQLKPDHADAYYNRGINQSMLGHYESAIKDFSQTINLKKDDADAYNSRAIIYLNQGHMDLGCSDARRACSMNVCEAFKIAKEKGLCR